MKQLPTDTMGQRIKEKRKKIKGMTQAVLAKEIGKTKDYISLLECGKSNGSLDTIKDIANALNTTTDYLLTGTDHSTENELIEILQQLPHEFQKDILALARHIVDGLNS